MDRRHIFHPVPGYIFPQVPHRIGGKLQHRDIGRRQGLCHTYGNTPAAAAKLQHTAFWPLSQIAYRRFRQLFRFGSGDQHPRPHLKFQPHELPFAQDILYRLPGGSPPQQGKVFFPQGRGAGVIFLQGVMAPVGAARRLHQQKSVGSGILAGVGSCPPPQQMLPLPQQLPPACFTSGRHFHPPGSPPSGRQWHILSGRRPARRW